MKPRAWFVIFGFLLILGGCSVLGPGEETPEVTPTPLPTTNPDEGLRVVAPTACQVRVIPTIHVDEVAGDMIAWSPDGKLLAYVAPKNQEWGWYSGNLTLLSMETGENRATRDISVTGDITWSPDGSQIGFTALESPQNIYTIMVLAVSDFSTVNLYGGGAATDEYGSRKGILKWTNNSRIQVVETCGVDCSRIVEFDLMGMTQRVLKTGRKQDDTSLVVALNQGKITPNPDWLLTNSSPDGKQAFYADEDGNGWLVDLIAKKKFQLDLAMGQPLQSKWSPDSNVVAVLTPEKVFIYDLTCKLDLTP